jgi:beta-xylosidase
LDRLFHDPSIFIDNASGRVFITHGYGEIRLTEMERNMSRVREGGIDRVIITAANSPSGVSVLEGSHMYWINGFYYIFTIAWVQGRRSVICYRSVDVDGGYEGRIVLNAGLGNRSGGVAQGGILQTPDDDWYGFFFQDRGAIGRVPVLVPMRWSDDGWPVFGDANGNIPVSFEMDLAVDFEQNLFVSDEFNGPALPLAWQWNHNPDNSKWSLTERPGFLRLTTGRISETIFHARNTLTMRTIEPACEGIIALEPSNMKDGDIAGLWALGPVGGFVGIEQENGEKFIVMYTSDYLRNSGILNVNVTRREHIPLTE